MNPQNPYVGLDYFAEGNAAFFFGRDAERRVIIGNLRAARLTLLYAQSGVGKSSLLRAGVAARLRELANRSSDEEEEGLRRRLVPVVFNAWRDDPVAGLIDEIEAAARPLMVNGSTLELPRDSLETAIDAAAGALDATALVMLDQFEDYFLYHGTDEAGERFADDLARCLNRDELPVHFLISIREDAYSSIGDRFTARVPNVYGNFLHLDYLDRRAARDAIVQPIEEMNRHLPEEAHFEIRPALVEQVLDEVRRGGGAAEAALESSDGGLERASDGSDDRFETAYLELVMERIWNEEARAGSRALRPETLGRLGGAKNIISTHVESALGALPDEQRTAMERAARFLVTSSGRKVAFGTRELAGFAEVSPEVLEAALRPLERRRIVRAVAAPATAAGDSPPSENGMATRWELFHDLLSEPLSKWHREADERRARERVRRAEDETRRAKLRFRLSVGLAFLALVGCIVAGVQWKRATDAKSETDSQEQAAAAVAAMGIDPHESLRLALAGLEEAETPQAENALRRALPASRLRAVLPHAPREADTGAGVSGRHPFVTSVSFGGDGETVATSDSTGNIRIWDWQAKRELMRKREAAWANHVAFFGGGKLLVSAASTRAAAWDVEDCVSNPGCRPVWTAPEAYLAFTARDGCTVAYVDAIGTNAQIRTLSGCQESSVCRPSAQTLPHGSAPVSMSFSADACTVASVTMEGIVKVWRDRGGRYRRLERMDGGWNQGTNVALSASGRLLAASGDRSFSVWDLKGCRGPASCRPMRSERTPDWAGTATFSPDETRLAMSSEDGVARVWDLESTEPLVLLRGHRDTVFGTDFDPSGRRLATAGADATARVWALAAGTVVGRNREAVVSARFTKDGRRIVTASDDGTVHIYERGERWREEAVLLVTARWNALSAYERRRVDRTRPVLDPLGTGEPVSAAAPSPDGRWLLTGTQGGDLKRWNVRTCLREFACEWWQGSYFGPTPAYGFAYVNGIEYEPKGRLVAVARDWAGTWILAASGKQRAVLLRDATQSASVAFSPTGNRLVTTSTDGKARVWDVSGCFGDGRCEPELVRALRHPCVVYTAAFSPDGSRLITGCGDRSARIWRWRERKPAELVLSGHTSNIRAVGFTPDGERVVTAGTDRTTRIWDAGSGRILGVVELHTDRVQSAVFNPKDPAMILTASDDGTTRLYRCTTCGPLEELRDLAEGRREAVDKPPRLLRESEAAPDSPGDDSDRSASLGPPREPAGEG